jgi:hypothetical protein
MKSSSHPLFSTVLRGAVFLCLLCGQNQESAGQEGQLAARDLADKLSANVLDGNSVLRLKMETETTGGKVVLQLQAKARRSKAVSDILYQVIWPKERKGEGFLLRQAANQAATGSVFTPPDSLRALTGGQMLEGVFGSGLAYEDLVGNFFSWSSQTLAGEEVLSRVPCQILESKPGKGDETGYTMVRSWIDVKRMVPMRIEKFGAGGRMLTRILTTRVARDDTGRQVPASFTVQRAGQEALTLLEGSNSKHDVTLTDADFSTEALRTAPGRGSKE